MPRNGSGSGMECGERRRRGESFILLYILLLNLVTCPVVESRLGGSDSTYNLYPIVDSVPLDHSGFGVYTMSVSIGTPPQRSIRLLVDMFSSDLWVPSPGSVANSSSQHTTYRPEMSSTFLPLNKSIDLSYEFIGTGAPKVTVDISEDFADVNGQRLSRLPIVFGVATSESPMFSSSSIFDGILGLALDSLGRVESGVSALTRLTNSSRRPTVFGLFLSDTWGSGPHGLAIGGCDTSKFWDPTEVPVLVPVLRSASSQSYDLWRISIPHVSMTGGVREEEKDVIRENGSNDDDAKTRTASLLSPLDVSPIGLFCGDGSGQGSYGGPICEAILDISSGFIGLPLLALQSILAAVNASVGGLCEKASEKIGGDYALDCPVSSNMPNLTFTVAGDKLRRLAGDDDRNSLQQEIPVGAYYSLSLTPKDYCLQNWTWGGGNTPIQSRTTCRTLLSLSSQDGSQTGKGSSENKAFFILGTPFLRAFYTLYDSSQSGFKAVGFASVRPYGISPSNWKPPPPSPSPSPPSNNNGINYNEVWAGVAGVAVGIFIAVGIWFIIRDKISNDDNTGYGMDEAGSIMIEDREDYDDDEFDTTDYEELEGGGERGGGGGGGGSDQKRRARNKSSGSLVVDDEETNTLNTSPLRLSVERTTKGSIQFLDVH